jgi:putative endonuclease
MSVGQGRVAAWLTRPRRFDVARVRRLGGRDVMQETRAETRTEKRVFGDTAEQLTVEHLEREGYVIRDRNVLCRRGELDVVAEKGNVLAFVEVRMRSTAVWGDPSATVTHAKQRKVVLAALEYCQRHRLFERVIRFDVASVVGKGKTGQVEHLIDAFDAGL